MALPASGQIQISQIQSEFSTSEGRLSLLADFINVNGQVRMSDFYSKSIPSATSLTAINIVLDQADLQCSFSNGNITNAQLRFEYGTSATLSTYSSTTYSTTTGTRTETISGLFFSTTYYYRCRIQYGTSLGKEVVTAISSFVSDDGF